MAGEQRMTVVAPARSVRARALLHATGSLVRAALLMAVVGVAGGCGRSANSSDARRQPVCTETHQDEDTLFKTNQQVIAETALARQREEFAGKVDARTVIAALLNNARAVTATYESVSNAVAGISSGEIISCVMEEYNPSARRLDARGRMEMLLFEVVYRRGEPNWTRPFALAQLGDYFTYHCTKFPTMYTWVQAEEDRLALSENASEAEKENFASVKIHHIMDLSVWPGRERECLAQIERVQELHRKGVVAFPEQPLQMLQVVAADCYLALGEETTARRIVEELYRTKDTLDASLQIELTDGVEAFLTRKKENLAKSRQFK